MVNFNVEVLPRIANKRFAFNLLEVIIAGFIFSTISIAFLGVWGLQVRGVEKSRHSLVATMLAEQVIEEVMAGGYELAPRDPVEDVITMETETRGAGGGWSTIEVDYSTEVVVNDIGDENDRLKQVMVKVSWEDTTGTREIVLETYLAGVF